jgi:hypothetical protein
MRLRPLAGLPHLSLGPVVDPSRPNVSAAKVFHCETQQIPWLLTQGVHAGGAKFELWVIPALRRGQPGCPPLWGQPGCQLAQFTCGAMEVLRERGLVESVHGRGTFVKPVA